MPIPSAESFQAGLKIVKDANLEGISDWLGCTLQDAPALLRRDLSLVMYTKSEVIDERRTHLYSLRKLAGDSQIQSEVDRDFAQIAESEAELRAFFETSSKEKDDLQEDSLAQLSFQHEAFRGLNLVPWALFALAMFKVWVVPAMTILFPILAWLLPYILLKFVYALPISQEQYTTILQTLWSGNIMSPTAELPSLWTPKSFFQGLFFLFTFAQSLIQPLQNAYHLYKTDRVFVTLGQRILQLRTIVRRMQQGLRFPLSRVLEDLPENDSRRAFIIIQTQPQRLFLTLKRLARLEVLWRIASKKELHQVSLQYGPTPKGKAYPLELEDAVDISLGEKGVASSVSLGGPKPIHAVITGPNGGGKSSFMRAVLQSVLLGHTYGYAPAKAASMPRFRWIASGLQLRDTPGVLSMFETEVKFAADTLATRTGPGLVLFDELFHSTNPPDGIRTATRFLKALWASPHIMSVVSTHVFSLVEAAPEAVQALCCQAEEREDGRIRYSYHVESGICRVSSVRTVWERFGLRGPDGTTKVSELKRDNGHSQ
jgi:hypothetical protein